MFHSAASDDDSEGGEVTPPEINESSYVHNFTANGLSSSFYTISGNLSAKGLTTV